MSTPLARSYSDKFVPGMSDYDLHQNKNQNWAQGKFTFVFYVVLIVLLWMLFHISRMFNTADCWTATNVVHGLITFVIFHWIRGSPDEATQGEYSGLTLYEQIDAGVPWTNNKKFLMLVPTVLTYFACQFADYQPIYVLVNVSMFLICIIAKIPEMHRVRILGINSSPYLSSNPSQDSLGSKRD